MHKQGEKEQKWSWRDALGILAASRFLKSATFRTLFYVWMVVCSLITIWLIITAIVAFSPHDYRPYGSVYVHECAFRGQRSLYAQDSGEKLIDHLDWIRWNGDSIAVYSASGKRGYINVNRGKLIVRPTFEKAWQFHDGIAAVQVNNRIGFINTTGDFAFNKLFPVQDESVTDKCFRDGYCIMVNDNGRVGIIDKEGDWALNPDFDFVCRDNNGWYRACRDGHSSLFTPSLSNSIDFSQIDLQEDTITVYTDSIKYKYILAIKEPE